MPTNVEEKEHTCIKCGASIDSKNKRAKYCSNCKSMPPFQPKEESVEDKVVQDEVVHTEQNAFTVKPGDEIGLNLRFRKFLRIPGLELAPSHPCGIVPEGTSAAALRALSISLEIGHLVRGKVPPFGVEKEEKALSKSAAILRLSVNDMKRQLGKIVRTARKGYINGYHPYEIVHHLYSLEKDHSARPGYLSVINSALQFLKEPKFKRGPIVNNDIDEVLAVIKGK